MPDSIRFVGPLLPPPSTDFRPPPWWNDIEKAGSIVLVTQGTLANDDLGQLVGPTLTALANEDLTVIASTGGPPVESIPVALPPNARAATFLPFDCLLPKVSVMVTNGGYGAVNYALSLGVPLVVAGDSEEKPEIATRVAFARHNAPDEIAEPVEDLAAGGTAASSHGNTRRGLGSVGAPAEGAGRQPVDVDAGSIRAMSRTI